ncbi:vasopressin V2 receptor isoform X2 [Danio rerio]|uniref:Vasopressin V2 receptor isoform X2 n=1 Tax=Danio rerio TaxID=7955 RepID=A0A8M3AYI4_DANRE|nr:vasopressin V2 receptor isoform X2 [Danio rerio]|eukprot:XP_009295200.1 vasopressin V2 receptor isoform X2 [Danio rerio]
METFSREPGWEGSPHATTAWTNFTSSLFSDHTGLNSTFRGGSYFWLVSQNSSINPTQKPGPVKIRDVALAQAEIGILGLVLALTTLGNSFILWVLLRRRKYNAPMHQFMVNLCVADLVVGFFQAYKGGAVSRWNTPIMVAWGLSLILSVPQVFIFSRSEVSPGVYECWGNFAEPWGLKAYVTWMTVAVFVLPTFIITVCQVRIFKEIHDNIYLKSERVVSVDLKKNRVIFHFPIFKKRARTVRETARRSGMPREARELHKKSTSSESSRSHTCNSEDAPEPDYCDQSCQDGYSPSNLASQTHSSSPDVLPRIQTNPHTIWSNSAAVQTSYGYSVPHRNSKNTTNNEDSNTSSEPSFQPCPLHPPLTGVSKAMSKTVKMTLVIVLVYTVCWSPFFIVQLWAAWDPNPPDQGVAFTILMLLASLNSCTNPWIYTAFSSSVSRELLALLRCRPKVPRRSSLYDHSSDINTSTTKDNQY